MPFSSRSADRLSSPERLERPLYLALQDSALAEDLAQELRQHGWRVRTFVNPDVLRNAARTHTPAAILMDLRLLREPRQGLDLLVELQDLAGHEVPLFFTSADGGFHQRLQAVQAGGSAFFPLPLNRSALLHRLHQLQQARAQPAGRVLLVDGASHDLRAASSALRDAGFAVDILDAPEQVLDRLDERPYDLLLVSAALGGIDPVELVQAVRQTEVHYPLPVLMLTADNKRLLDDGASAAGVDAIIGLPIEPKDLVAIARARIERALGLRSAFEYLARHDPVTGLFNRRHFIESLRSALAGGGRGGALLYVLIPAASGNTAAAVAEALRRQLPPLAVAAQVEADGIAVLLPGADSGEFERLAQVVAARLREAPGAGPASPPRCHVGMTLLTGQQRSSSEIIGRARQAAELQARDNAPTSERTEGAEHAWAAPVRAALRDGRFRLVYQPIANLSGQPTSYYEVFVRMLDGASHDILPQEFLPAAERAGLATELDQWITARAIHVLAEQKSLRHQPILFVKLFADTVASAHFPEWLKGRLAAASVAPARLVFQITQRTASLRLAETCDFITALRAIGCLVALEHVGVDGDAGPELIKRLKPDFVKLSPQLTSDIGANLEHQKAVQAVAGHCRSLGARTIAALVQDALNLSVLWRCGVEYIQGYFMQEPVDVFSSDETLS